MSEASIPVGEAASDAERRAIYEGLQAFNARFLGPSDHRAAQRDGAGRRGSAGRARRRDGPSAGSPSTSLWVSEAHRRQGLGLRLLQAAETEARRRGCRHAQLWTFDFQARPFYERHGFRLFGTLDGYPNGHRSFFMRKDL